MAQSIQHDPAALILELSAASTPNIHSPIASPGSQLHDAIVSIPLVQNIRQVRLSRHAPSQILQTVPPSSPLWLGTAGQFPYRIDFQSFWLSHGSDPCG